MKKTPYLISGVLLLLVSMGVSGCGASTSATAQSSTSTTAGQTSQQNNQAQAPQGQRTSNPALQTTMELRRLQGNSQMALTSDQKTKLKPILQGLINTTNPSQDYLQQQSDAMNALLTDQQKSFLTQPRTSQARNNNTSHPDGNNSSQKGNSRNKVGSNEVNSNGTQNNDQKGRSFQPQEIYQQFLDSLN